MLADQGAGLQVVDQGGRAARQGQAVAMKIVDAGGLGGQATVQTESAVVEVAGRELVVADQQHAVVAGRETAHAVGLAGDQQAVTHRLPGLGDHLVGKAFRQIEQMLGIADQRAVAVNLVDVALAGHLAGLGEGEAREAEAGGETAEQGPARKHDQIPRRLSRARL